MAKNWTRVLITIGGLASITLLLAIVWIGNRDSNSGLADLTPEDTHTASGPGAAASSEVSTESSTHPKISRPSQREAFGTRSSDAAEFPSPDTDARSRPEPSPQTRRLVKSLSEIDLVPGALTPKRVEAWKKTLLELQDHGTGAVPAIEEFFERNVDMRLDSGPGANLLGERTLRIALMKVLFDIPAPENVDLQARVLRTTIDPDEIAVLARQLELQAPGEYRDAIIEAAKGSLDNARKGNLPGRDTGPLIKLLNDYEADVK